MFAQILAWLFPPILPGKMQDWPEPAPYRTVANEQGWAGNVQRQFTGIEKHWMMEPEPKQPREWQKRYRAQQAESRLARFAELGPLQQLTLVGPAKK